MKKLRRKEIIKLLDNLKSEIIYRLSEEAKKLEQLAIHSKAPAVDYYNGMKTGMVRAAILVHKTPIPDENFIPNCGAQMERSEDE